MRQFLAWMFGGCPICFNLLGMVRDRDRQESWCPKCHNKTSDRLWRR